MATYTASSFNSMEAYRPQGITHSSSENSTQRQSSTDSDKGHVSFNNNREEEKEKRQKYLTARYGQHQMMLIRKRLAVEDWIYNKLRELYDCQEDEDDHDCNLDLEEILNFDSEEERRDYVQKELVNTKKSPEVVQDFVEQLIEKAKTL